MPHSASRPPEGASGDDRGSGDTFPRARPPTSPDNLPLRLSSFVGREREITQVKELLTDHRLLTLTGAGGSGKTRLALEVATKVVDAFDCGVWLVEFAPLSEPDLVARAVASVLGVREAPGNTLTGALADYLEAREILLLLDNCEHLVDASASLAGALLSSCPNLRILATSRETLGVPGEAIFAVPHLSLPDPRHLSAAEGLPAYEAARLFAERAKAVKPDFQITERNAMALAQVCYRLDGMPLAIELAAARAKVLSVEQIASRLDDRFALLTGSRKTLAHHGTLRATMEWSHDLLSEEERTLLRRLAVFAGSWTIAAAEAVCAGEGLEESAVLDLLASLVDKSLVLVSEQDGEARYGFLETVRQYASEKLEESGEGAEVRRRHARYYLALAEGAEPASGEQGEWPGRLRTEQDNLWAALSWSLDNGEGDLGLRLGGALGALWGAHGHPGEGQERLERGLAQGATSPAPERAKALNRAGWISLSQGDYGGAVALLEESLGLLRELGDEPGVANSLFLLGHTALHKGERRRLKTLCEEAEALLAQSTDRWTLAELRIFLGMAALYEDDPERALALLGESLALFRESGDTGRVALCLPYLWMTLLELGDYERAVERIEEELRLLRRLGKEPQGSYGLLGLAVVAASRRQPARVARLCGAAESLRESSGLNLPLWDHTPTDFEGRINAIRSRLGEKAWEAAWAEGRVMGPERAVAYALEQPEAERTEAPEGAEEATPAYPAGLSAREVEVLRLLAKGMTNPQIAKALFISPRTVDAHLRSVYHKCGSSTRVEAARFASEHGL